MTILRPCNSSPLHRYLSSHSFKGFRGIAGAPTPSQIWDIGRPFKAGKAADRFRCLASASPSVKSDPQSLPIDPDALHLPRYCAGCGVGLQAENPDLPGYYKVPKKLLEPAGTELNDARIESAPEEASGDPAAAGAMLAAQRASRRASNQEASASGRQERAPEDDVFERFNSLLDDWVVEEEPKVSVRDLDIAAAEEDTDEARILCARCYSLSHYGRIKSQRAEAALPQFDLGRKVGRKIGLQKLRRAVVLVVVDAADFDGSLPRAALEGLFANIEGYQGSQDNRQQGRNDRDVRLLQGSQDNRQQGRSDRDVRLVLAVNKADLLPSQATPRRLEAWVRRRARQGGMPQPAAVMLVSAVKGTGVDQLLIQLHREVGSSGDVWVVGAQNAGKSSLINAMRRAVGHRKPQEELTTAPLPGTTLGMLKVPGLMPARCKMFDTPGVPHAHQLSSRLNPEEVKMLLPRRKLKPRTFRAAVGQTIFVGGVLRVDVQDTPGATLYVTVWASDELICHFGKTESADERYQQNMGSMLAPPLSAEHSLGPLVPHRVTVEGSSWRESSTDIAIAGVGWLGIGVSGSASFDVWTHDGVAITTREAVIPDFARDLERPGFGSKEQQKKIKGKAKAK
ncbi:g9719 [Coccomyxa viridis]|uniref:G9719 protein n=1 Tax=Coccomyxa viridis TaxID=1274662 RepID=A0ABP1G9V0_9CHLO